MKRLKLLLFLLPFGFTTLCAQENKEIESDTLENNREAMGGGESEAIDTLDTKDKFTKIVIFEDFTWSYIQLEKPDIDEESLTENWDSERIHAYQDVEIAALPDVTDLVLIDSLHAFCIPIKGKVYSKYGYRHKHPHRGVDIPLNIGDSVLATFDGMVRIAESSSKTGGYGNLIILRHPNGLETYYGHLSKILVQEGELVTAGELIGYGGNTGRSTGPHLHYETRYMGKAFDPERVIDFDNANLRSDTLTLKKDYLNINSRYASSSKNSSNTAPAQSYTYHKIRSGDTLGAIAQKYHTTIDKICKLNRISRNTTLQIGRKLKVRVHY